MSTKDKLAYIAELKRAFLAAKADPTEKERLFMLMNSEFLDVLNSAIAYISFVNAPE